MRGTQAKKQTEGHLLRSLPCLESQGWPKVLHRVIGQKRVLSLFFHPIPHCILIWWLMNNIKHQNNNNNNNNNNSNVILSVFPYIYPIRVLQTVISKAHWQPPRRSRPADGIQRLENLSPKKNYGQRADTLCYTDADSCFIKFDSLESNQNTNSNFILYDYIVLSESIGPTSVVLKCGASSECNMFVVVCMDLFCELNHIHDCL